MSETQSQKGVLRRDSVRVLTQPALVDCSASPAGQQTIAVVPLLDGDRVAGFEIRCGCGANAVVECVYRKET
jgi:hypothetical protein